MSCREAALTSARSETSRALGSITEATYRRLREDILMGHAAPGAKLRLDALKEQYATSTATLREVLARLASEGLVLAEGQRGFAVAPISAAELRDIAQVRLLVEEHALRRSLAEGDLEWEGRVTAAHHLLARYEAEMSAGRVDAITSWRQADWGFHQALISACGSALLMRSHAEIFDKYLRYQMIALAFRPVISVDEHVALAEAALRRDADAACATLRNHLAGGLAHAISLGMLRD